MIEPLRRSLVNHVLHHIGAALQPGEQIDLTPFLNCLPGGSNADADIFGMVTGAAAVPSSEALEALAAYQRATGYAASQRLAQPGSLPNPATHFDVWAALVEAELRTQPGTREEQGVSLATEFKLLSAIGHATDGDAARLEEGFTLVSGDFPGIQRVIYTIASDGATKGVRGRSFFLQLLAECVVRRILWDLDLPVTNALYMAGGRFLILAPANTDVSALHNEINAQLLEWFEGDLSLVLASVAMSVQALRDHRVFQSVTEALHTAELEQKQQPFLGLFANDFFDPSGIGSEYYCAISRREPRTPEEVREAETARSNQQAWVSPEQRAFRLLAEDLAQAAQGYILFMPAYIPHPNPKRQSKSDYAHLLYAITGWSARLLADERDALAAATEPYALVRLNSTDFDPRYMHGFRFLAAHTPHVMESDLKWWRAHPDEEETEPRVGQTIRTFELLATRGDEDNGFARLGLLRMDVDNLGDVFSQRLQGATLTRQMALSSALSEFFEAYLPKICGAFESFSYRPNSLYLLYGGGDDLFIVGEWDLMPLLAERIHDLLYAYSQGKLTISAGIELIPVKFPFYVGAERARSALDNRAKRYNPRNEQHPRKNAISMLGQVFGWAEGEAWGALVDLRERLHRVIRSYKPTDRTSESDQKTIVRNVSRVYERWRQDYVQRGERYLKYGPFCWMAAYQFTRIREGIRGDDEEKLKADIDVIQQVILENIELGGTAARWVEYEWRSWPP